MIPNNIQLLGKVEKYAVTRLLKLYLHTLHPVQLAVQKKDEHEYIFRGIM